MSEPSDDVHIRVSSDGIEISSSVLCAGLIKPAPPLREPRQPLNFRCLFCCDLGCWVCRV